jgi:hypothetical protein
MVLAFNDNSAATRPPIPIAAIAFSKSPTRTMVNMSSRQSMHVHRSQRLPPQAWLLHLSVKTSLWCGDSVEIWQNALFEGAWAGAFGKGDFSNCANVFGSGAMCTSNGWLLVPPSHTLDALYALRLNNGEWIASNSIAFIKQHSSARLPTSDNRLFRNFVGIVRGIEYSPRSFRCSNGEFYILHHHNALLGPAGLTIQSKVLPPDFDDFAGYKNYLLQTVYAVATNAADPARRKCYRLLATISTGYDSPAGTVLARTAGCCDAITFVSAREGKSDDGSAIGQQLGLNVAAFERPDIAGEARETTAEFFATGMQAVDLVFEALRGQLTGRILVTGFHGDKVWDLGEANSVLKRGDISGSSLGEFRLSQDFIHLPVTFIGALRHPSILRISKSSEMKAFSIAGHYNRPIPRRIVEEAGVSREAFGHAKKAIVMLIHGEPNLLSHQIRSEIERSLITRSFIQRLAYRLRSARFSVDKFFFDNLAIRVSNLLPIGGGFYLRTCQRILHAGRFASFIEHSHPFNALAFEWALSVVAERYARMRECPDPPIAESLNLGQKQD